MKAIINVSKDSEYFKYNGLTFPVLCVFYCTRRNKTKPMSNENKPRKTKKEKSGEDSQDEIFNPDARNLAFSDIYKETGKDKFFERVYLHSEKDILEYGENLSEETSIDKTEE